MEPTRALRELIGTEVVLGQGEVFLPGTVIAVEAVVASSGDEQVFLTVELQSGCSRIELVPPEWSYCRWLGPIQNIIDPKRDLTVTLIEGASNVAQPDMPDVRSRPSSLAG
jgi:hypothetical protein